MIRIVIAEDHEMVRQGLRSLLVQEKDFAVIGEAEDGNETVERVSKTNPDVLLLDLTLPRLHGLNVIVQLRNYKAIKIIVLSMHRDDASVLEALRLGARGYVLKDSPASELISAIRSVMRDEMFVSPPLASMVQQAALNGLSGKNTQSQNELTRRERLVLQLAADGKRSQTVAEELGISVRTAEKHRANLMRKLQIRSQGDLLRYAIRHNIVQA